MILQLLPRDYMNMRWDVAPKNILDTVSGSAMINRADTEQKVVYNTDTVQGFVGSTLVNFPVDLGDVQFLTHYTWLRRTHTNVWRDDWYHQKGRSEQVRASGKFTVVIDVPVEGANAIRMIPEGHSYELYEGVKPSWDMIPSDLPILKSSTPFDSYFTSFYGNYRKVALNAEFSRIGRGSPAQSYNKPGWFFDTDVSTSSTDEGYSPNSNATTYFMTTTMKPLGNNAFEISWNAPIKHLVMGVSRTGDFWGGPGSVHDWAFFCDVITSIKFEISGRPFNTESISFSYSLLDGKVTSNAKNTYPLKLDSSELVTLNSTIDGKPYQEEMSRILLEKFENGKYQVVADIRGVWMLRNGVKINTLMEVYDLKGSKISKENVPVVFEVKAIEKCFRGSSFYYRTLLLEV